MEDKETDTQQENSDETENTTADEDQVIASKEGTTTRKETVDEAGGETTAQEEDEDAPSDDSAGEDTPFPEDFDPSMFTPPTDVPTLVKIIFPMLAESAWQNLGLMVKPGSTEGSMDLKQVKLAIDSMDALFRVIGEEMEETERKEIQGLLTNLRLNFVQKSS